ncbi:protein ALTERED PHOSPHATE STARVATION RESPONSE 1-like isoform X2 [Vitis riparia]|uniref:protein ALTERED PHOSPHATE STARVATION RESPONSE 1-like isoform X2 n=1 Tax=Vitis riparia TaxID=96939 RepID=UPI00155A5917|nr:protein ALTERED PHOSPHATE STARVATION RESPONSE 1-like isoform X2 [Vitis riparia]
MGCATSKLDDLPAVALCRDRCNFLEDSVQLRYDLADAHVAYMQSLTTIGVSLHRVFDHVANHSDSKTKDDAVAAATACAGDSLGNRSGSDCSHLQFRSDSEDDNDGGSESLKNNYVLEHETLGSINYEKNHPAQSVACYSFPDYGPNSYQYFDSSTAYNGEMITGFFHAPSPSPLPASGGGYGSDSKPPPSPPRNSAWDFLNLFDESYKLQPYSPMRGLEGVRDEGKQEVAKEERKFDDGAGNCSKVAEEEGQGRNIGQSGTSASREDAVVECAAHTMEKRENVDSDKEPVEERSDSATIAPTGTQGVMRSVSEAMREIHVLFERASESGGGVSKMLEAGKLNYHPKSGVYQVSSKMLHVITPSLLVVSSQPSTENIGSIYLDLNEDMGMSSGNLSSTLKKLHMWEKKLYDEVKGEEKLRIMHERKCKQLKLFDEKGADAQKAETTQTLVQSISTKIRIAIDVVDKISITINKLRDEELWPQINELIHGFNGMWKAMLECLKSQSQAVSEANSLDAIICNGKLSDDYLEALIELKLELQNWNLRFTNWIDTQKGFVKGLNSWLLRCLLYEPEETPDGAVPISPTSVGAPPVFVICNQWAEAMERFSAEEVVEAIQAFFTTVNQLLELHSVDLQQRMIADKDMERKVKNLEKKEQKMQKVMQAGEKKMTLEPGESGSLLPGVAVKQAQMINVGSLQSGLRQIFEAMERFTANLMQSYEELLVSIEDAKCAQGNP